MRAVSMNAPPLQDEQRAKAIELSVVMPCLNEAETLGLCIAKAQRALREGGIDGEVIVADNGSTDGSREIAEKLERRWFGCRPRAMATR